MPRKANYGFTAAELLLLAIMSLVVGGVAWKVLSNNDVRTTESSRLPVPQQDRNNPEHGIYPQVWTKNGYDGASYEFKVNCCPDYKKLEACFLWDLTRVSVTDPSGQSYELKKDFNIQEYSGEITRRWVIYGEADADFPKPGQYTFAYFKDNKEVYSQVVDYSPKIISYPTNIKIKQRGSDLYVSWTPPEGMKQGMTYKVIVFRNNQGVISKLLEWNTTEAILENLPLQPGEKASMNVSSYFDGGYAYPRSIDFIWR